MKHIYHSTSKIDRIGLFAGENIKKDEVIQHIKGEIKLFVPRNKKESLTYPDWIGIGKHRWIDPQYPNEYLNHSCNPNSSIKGKVTMVALKNIKEGEEITIDYSIIEGDDMWKMKCNCGEKNCRKIIRSIQYLPTRTFKKYLPYIPTYFKKVYKTYNGNKNII
ncbi:MAG: Nuclear protein SET [Parcubacteria group bacterium GW2011_GWF2_39_8b]|uniref:SET domain-containing protein n=2 Tax=Candidatus Zambryskiibacteriota TaxID=1817925 RepID=A0A1G2T9I8_9BACT|nr:MAG: Nuclear protein SET [Parcubacteria group bacterium GW2011_GWF2_39_8b]KKR46012.1 MAG: Nuclear protein SET [Parcubacteria group bacterium GW2011_GWA2_40_14]OHA93944.1 MAG: hypothetical protein A2W58_01030 [Candidatus Zambryskibacteria bacterium RIFCSPHIGHO2_02_38_10.5]OHA95516.1 MAG: hypothetical protein A3C63_00530 [Candidatus Zambryskibacteria bacterium RIFCSPHIGHO2_02_FULL_39_82]OHA98936.1 MAG: hypothetical protein A3E32_01385 [Candidatus Zambryskibacteria bacterium RIFCSPHIGHO2_12_FUL